MHEVLKIPTGLPFEWRLTLSEIQEVCPGAVLAGGALRDLVLGRPVKDLDIFINAPHMRAAEGLIAALREHGFVIVFEHSETTAYPEDENLEVVAIADVTGLYSLPVQLIFVNWDTARILDRFDYGICKLAYDGKELSIDPEFHVDFQDMVFRLRRDRPTPVSLRGSVHRYARLTAEKYPGWTWQAADTQSGWGTFAADDAAGLDLTQIG